MLNYTQLTWKLACMFKKYWSCNPTVGVSEYEYDNMLLGGAIFFKVTTDLTWILSYIS